MNHDNSSFTLHPSSFPWRYTFCCTFPVLRFFPSEEEKELGRWALPTTASCGARTFLSPDNALTPVREREPGNDRPAGLQTSHSMLSTKTGAWFFWHASRPGSRLPLF